MSVYYDETTKTWYSKVRYKNWQGERKQTTKRGFTTKREAKQWEAEYVKSQNFDMSVTLAGFVDIYFEDKRQELKIRTISNKRYMMERHVLPYLGKRLMCDIKAPDIIKWQNELKSKGYSETYLRMIQNQITALFTHACRVYGLQNNPCVKVKKMGRADAEEMQFWTKEEYDRFIRSFAGNRNDWHYVFFEILFWTGLREGEALALTNEDILYDNNQIRVNKTYYRHNRVDYITNPKTSDSVRIVDIPEFLKKEISDYHDRLYQYPDNERLFPYTAEAVQHIMKSHVEKSGVKKIRVHDLRHSHVAYLISQGVEPLLIKNRLGHKDIRITLNTYGHLYPTAQKQLAEMLNAKK